MRSLWKFPDAYPTNRRCTITAYFKTCSHQYNVAFLLSIPVAYYLAYTRSRLKPYCEAVVALPLVLPPSVLGFYLLLLFSRKGFLGNLWDKIFGHQLGFPF